MEKYENLLHDDNQLKSWAYNFINVYDHYLSHLTPNLKEDASYKLFHLPMKELMVLVEAAKVYKNALELYPVSDEYRDAMDKLRLEINKKISSLNYSLGNFNEFNVLESPAQA